MSRLWQLHISKYFVNNFSLLAFLFATYSVQCVLCRRGYRKKHLGGLAPLKFPSPSLFPTLFPSTPLPSKRSLPSLFPFPSLSFSPPSPFLFPDPFLSLPFSLSPFPSPPFPPLRSRPPVIQLGDLGERCNLVHFSLKIRHLVATILMIFPRVNRPNFKLSC